MWDNLQSKKRLFLILGSIGLVIVMIVLLLLTREGSQALLQSQLLAKNILFPDIKDDKIRFFTGSAFAELPKDSQVAQRVSREFRFPRVDKVVWLEQGAVIRAAALTTSDELFALAGNDESLLERSSWWLINFQINAVTPLGTPSRQPGDVVASLQHDSLFYTTNPSTSTTEIRKCPVADGCQSSELITTTNSQTSLIGDTVKGVLFQEGGALQLVGEEIEAGDSGFVDPQTTPDGHHVIFRAETEEGLEASPLLFSYDIESQVIKRLSDKTHQFFVTPTGEVAVSHVNKVAKLLEVKVFHPETGARLGSFSSVFAQPVDVGALALKLDPDNPEITLVGIEGFLFLFSPGESRTEIKEVPIVSFESSFEVNGLYYSYNGLHNILFVNNRAGLPFESVEQRVYQLMADKQLDPQQTQKVWLMTPLTNDTMDLLRQAGVYPNEKAIQYYEPVPYHGD